HVRIMFRILDPEWLMGVGNFAGNPAREVIADLGRALARFYIRARLALLQTMTGPASPPRNCATWAFGNKDRGGTRFRQTGAGLTILPRPGTFVCVKDSYGTLPRDGGGFCHRPRFRGRKGNLARRCYLGDMA